MSENQFDVDRDRLDEEWMAQPNRVKEASEKYADARRDAALAKRELEVMEAEVSLDVRKNPGDYGLDKTTEKSIEATIAMDSRIIEANNKVIQAEHDKDICFAATQAYEHKKKALEDLVFLFARDYFSSPKVPDSARNEIGKMKRDQAFGRGKQR